jgi:hypothetical protein
MIASLLDSTRICRPLASALPVPEIAAITGPLDSLVDRNVLVLADDENLYYGARDLGYRLSFSRLRECLQRRACRCYFHAFFSREPGDESRCRHLRERGWIPHPRDIETVQTHRGTERLANCDNDFLFAAGKLASRGNGDVIVLASGDGNLICDVARNLRQIPRARTIVTLSLAGSTSYRLDAVCNPHIDGNIEIGLDCLQERSRP